MFDKVGKSVFILCPQFGGIPSRSRLVVLHTRHMFELAGTGVFKELIPLYIKLATNCSQCTYNIRACDYCTFLNRRGEVILVYFVINVCRSDKLLSQKESQQTMIQQSKQSVKQISRTEMRSKMRGKDARVQHYQQGLYSECLATSFIAGAWKYKTITHMVFVKLSYFSTCHDVSINLVKRVPLVLYRTLFSLCCEI